MEELKDFPSWGWICKLNESRYFSGSVGTDSQKGLFASHTFQYKMWRKEDTLHISCYVRTPEGERYGEDEMSCELSGENVDAVKAWLLDQMRRYDCVGKEQKTIVKDTPAVQ